MEFIHLTLIVGTAVIGGFLAQRFKQTWVLGSIIGGIVAGPILATFLNFIMPANQEFLKGFHPEVVRGNIGILIDLSSIFILFMAGLETDINMLKKAGKSGFLTAVGGIIFPFLFGFLGGYYIFHFNTIVSLYIGTAISITSVALSVAVLVDINKLKTKAGMTIIVAAIVDDIIGIFLLSIVTGFSRSRRIIPKNILILFVIISLFILIMLLLLIFIQRVKERYTPFKRFNARTKLGIFLIIMLIFASLAHSFKLHLMIGAFFAGLILSIFLKKNEKINIGLWTWGFFGPLFFGWIGYSVKIDFSVLNWTFLFIFASAFIGKIIGAGIGAKLSGLSFHNSTSVGVGMNSRGGIDLVVAESALSIGIIDRNLFSILVFTSVITIFITPFLLSHLKNQIE